jgi:hypothetical protein
MPFDGMEFRAPTPVAADIFPNLRIAGCHLWIKARLRQAGIAETCPDPGDYSVAVIQLLTDARATIEAPENWVRGAYRWFRGRRCAIGALRAAARTIDDIRVAWSAYVLLRAAVNKRRFSSVELMNDQSSHAEVLRAFDEAIAMARGQAAA